MLVKQFDCFWFCCCTQLESEQTWWWFLPEIGSWCQCSTAAVGTSVGKCECFEKSTSLWREHGISLAYHWFDLPLVQQSCSLVCRPATITTTLNVTVIGGWANERLDHWGVPNWPACAELIFMRRTVVRWRSQQLHPLSNSEETSCLIRCCSAASVTVNGYLLLSQESDLNSS